MTSNYRAAPGGSWRLSRKDTASRPARPSCRATLPECAQNERAALRLFAIGLVPPDVQAEALTHHFPFGPRGSTVSGKQWKIRGQTARSFWPTMFRSWLLDSVFAAAHAFAVSKAVIGVQIARRKLVLA